MLQQVGPAQYDMSMKACKRVCVRLSENAPKFCLEQTSEPDLRPTSDSSTDALASNASACPTALYGEDSLAQEFADIFGLTDELPVEDGTAGLRSPLTWFGIMVPDALRQSKVSFEKALEVSVKLAELHTELLLLK